MTEQEMPPGRSGTKAPAAAGGRRGSVIVRQVLAFGLETALLFAVAYTAIAVFPGHGTLAAVAALAAAVALWGLFMAPRARLRLPWPVLPIVATFAFLAGAGALKLSGLLPAALVLAAAAVINLVWDLAAGSPAAGSPSRAPGRRAAG